MSVYDSFDVGGLPDCFWLEAFNSCHDNIQGSIIKTAWPDGEGYTAQENLMVQMFQIMRSELQKMQVEKNGKRH